MFKKSILCFSFLSISAQVIAREPTELEKSVCKQNPSACGQSVPNYNDNSNSSVNTPATDPRQRFFELSYAKATEAKLAQVYAYLQSYGNINTFKIRTEPFPYRGTYLLNTENVFCASNYPNAPELTSRENKCRFDHERVTEFYADSPGRYSCHILVSDKRGVIDYSWKYEWDEGPQKFTTSCVAY